MFRALKIIENEPKNGSKITKNRFRATPHQRQKKHVANPKNESKKLKNPRFFHFFLAEVWRAGQQTSLSRTVFYSVLWRRASRPIKNRRFFPKKATPQVNLNLSWLMPSGWSRPLQLRCGRISWVPTQPALIGLGCRPRLDITSVQTLAEVRMGGHQIQTCLVQFTGLDTFTCALRNFEWRVSRRHYWWTAGCVGPTTFALKRVVLWRFIRCQRLQFDFQWCQSLIQL